ncbi:hypothetical protein IWX90DRAFT_439 [Phyllosticta citrichinensis]|uniref:Uncharacterized protein n=1 Tax=Phyllosticta citrichinensis TaxID=1130410 RepID=A0ABR1Y5Y1_9PEZI
MGSENPGVWVGVGGRVPWERPEHLEFAQQCEGRPSPDDYPIQPACLHTPKPSSQMGTRVTGQATVSGRMPRSQLSKRHSLLAPLIARMPVGPCDWLPRLFPSRHAYVSCAGAVPLERHLSSSCVRHLPVVSQLVPVLHSSRCRSRRTRDCYCCRLLKESFSLSHCFFFAFLIWAGLLHMRRIERK